MRSFAILNQKGGVGKTTTSVNLSAALAAGGKKVLLVDMDPQAHASLHLGVSPEDSRQSVYELLTGEASADSLRVAVNENLSLIPAHIDLAAVDAELAGQSGRETVLRDRLAALADPPDMLVVDCPPSLSLLALNALVAVKEVLLPLQPHFLALHGLSKLLQTVDLVAKRLNPELRLTGVVLCLFEANTRLATEVSDDVAEFFAQSANAGTAWSRAKLLTTRIRRNIRLAEAPSFGQSILQYAPSSPGAEDYRALAAELRGLE